ncbi:hypothetical protein A2U01_0075178, partial [Trifolium medium]|nr:hypothetical protein [Trifolium medium]
TNSSFKGSISSEVGTIQRFYRFRGYTSSEAETLQRLHCFITSERQMLLHLA